MTQFCSFLQEEAAEIEQRINEELDLISSWLRANKLFLNVSKPEAMLFGTYRRLCNVDTLNIRVDGQVIKRVYEFKYLGVVFVEHISWNTHVKYVLTRTGKRVEMLSRIRTNLTTHCANVIYTSFIRPVLNYCDTAWNCCGEGNTSSLERLQRRAPNEL